MRKVACAEGDIQKERSLGCDGLLITDKSDGAIHEHLAQMVAVARDVDGVVVLEQLGVPLVGERAVEATPTVEASGERPVTEWPGGGRVGQRGEVPLTGRERVIAVL